MKYSRCPWSAHKQRENGTHYYIIASPSPRARIPVGNQVAVAPVKVSRNKNYPTVTPVSAEECFGNLQLIVHAPEMYEMLQGIWNTFGILIHGFSFEYMNDTERNECMRYYGKINELFQSIEGKT